MYFSGFIKSIILSVFLLFGCQHFALADGRKGGVKYSPQTMFPVSPYRLKVEKDDPNACKVCDKAEEQLRKGCTLNESSISPYAEHIFLRQTIKVSQTPEMRKSIIAAVLSQDARFAMQISRNARSASDVPSRFAANLIVAYSLVKTGLKGNQDAVRNLVTALRKDETAVPFSTADVDFLEALLEQSSGDKSRALRLLDKALEKEPTFFNAAVLASRLQITRIRKAQNFSPRECKASYDNLFRYLGMILDLRSCPRQAVHVEIFLRRLFSNPDSNPAISAASVYLGVLARKHDYAKQAMINFQRTSETECKGYVASQLKELLARTSVMIKRN